MIKYKEAVFVIDSVVSSLFGSSELLSGYRPNFLQSIEKNLKLVVETKGLCGNQSKDVDPTSVLIPFIDGAGNKLIL